MKWVILFLVVVSFSCCSGSEDYPCVELCLRSKQKLIEMIPTINPATVCTESDWAKAKTCEQCKQLFGLLYDVQFTDDPCSD